MFQRWVNGALDFQIRLDSRHRPEGPDGEGRNRLAIHTLEPTPRCVLRPLTWQAALDTLRGMAHHGGDPCSYGPCVGAKCETCGVADGPRIPWDPGFRVREREGRVVVEGRTPQVFSSWSDMMKAMDAPALRRAIDGNGVYWMAAS